MKATSGALSSDDRCAAKRNHGWLEAEPGLSAQQALSRLTALAPDRFKEIQQGTAQLAVMA